MRKIAAAILLAAFAGGCTTTQVASVPYEPAPTPTPSPSPSSSAHPVEGGPFPEPPTDCTGREGLDAVVTGRDAATGTQFMSVWFINCSEAAVDLSGAVFTGVDPDATVHGLSYDTLGTAPTLEPGDGAGLLISWANNGRCERGVERLLVDVAGSELDLTQDCLLLGGEYAAERDHPLSLDWGSSS